MAAVEFDVMYKLLIAMKTNDESTISGFLESGWEPAIHAVNKIMNTQPIEETIRTIPLNILKLFVAYANIEDRHVQAAFTLKDWRRFKILLAALDT